MQKRDQKLDIEIVVIEDEPDILEYHLGKEGYSVTGFFSTQNVEQSNIYSPYTLHTN